MKFRNIRLAAITMSVLASGAYAQTSFPEVEPNTNKAEADVNGTITLVAGDSITGTTTGTITTAASTLLTSVDQFRIKTGALPLGIYKHTLTITTTGTAGHTGTLRGLNQTTGGVIGTTDTTIQTSSTTSTPPRANTWFGFGKQEELYYRVTGGTATTAPYVSTLTTTAVTPVAVPGTFVAGTFTISTIGQTTIDTEVYVYDANLNLIIGYHNDDEGPAGTTAQSRIVRTLPAGTYYVAVSDFNICNNLSDSNADEDFQTGGLMDFPNVIATSDTDTAPVDYDVQISDGVTPTVVTLVGNGFFDAAWATFTVAGVLPTPANDNCASATALSGSGLVTSVISAATNDGAASCDPGGASSKDVWYSFSGGPNGSTLSVDTCPTVGVDTVLSVYAACGGTELACNDNCGGTCSATGSCVSVSVGIGQTVLVRLSDKGLGGDFVAMRYSNVPNPPANDLCSTPIALAGPGLYPFDTTAATTGQGFLTTGCASVIGGKNVWYTYTATTTGTLTVSTCGSVNPSSTSQDTKVAIYSGTACPVAGGLACNDDAGATLCASNTANSVVSTPTTCGATYIIEVGNFSTTLTVNIFGDIQVTEVGTSCSTPVTYYCFGDGTGTACPCANNGAVGNGCGNGVNPNGANLAASGIASVSGDTWLLSGSGVPNGPSAIADAGFLPSVRVSTASVHPSLLCAASKPSDQ